MTTTRPDGSTVDPGTTDLRGARSRWRVVDLVVAAVLGVACGVVFWAWGVAWTPVSAALAFAFPVSALLSGPWLVAGVLGGLVVRKPGAAVLTEVVGALVEAMIGNQWGLTSVWYGLAQGVGAELVLAVFLYRRFGPVPALLAGAGAGVAAGLLDTTLSYAGRSGDLRVLYVLLCAVSGAVVAGLGGWLLTRALAATGALAPLASGRAARRV